MEAAAAGEGRRGSVGGGVASGGAPKAWRGRRHRSRPAPSDPQHPTGPNPPCARQQWQQACLSLPSPSPRTCGHHLVHEAAQQAGALAGGQVLAHGRPQDLSAQHVALRSGGGGRAGTAFRTAFSICTGVQYLNRRNRRGCCGWSTCSGPHIPFNTMPHCCPATAAMQQWCLPVYPQPHTPGRCRQSARSRPRGRGPHTRGTGSASWLPAAGTALQAGRTGRAAVRGARLQQQMVHHQH